MSTNHHSPCRPKPDLPSTPPFLSIEGILGTTGTRQTRPRHMVKDFLAYSGRSKKDARRIADVSSRFWRASHTTPTRKCPLHPISRDLLGPWLQLPPYPTLRPTLVLCPSGTGMSKRPREVQVVVCPGPTFLSSSRPPRQENGGKGMDKVSRSRPHTRHRRSTDPCL